MRDHTGMKVAEGNLFRRHKVAASGFMALARLR